MNALETASTLNNLASICHYTMFWYTPYKTGNLARNGISDVQTLYDGNWGYAVGFKLFERPGVWYGKLLNEQPIINYRIQNQVTGRVYSGSYINKHYRWVDNYSHTFAALIPLYAPVRRVA